MGTRWGLILCAERLIINAVLAYRSVGLANRASSVSEIVFWGHVITSGMEIHEGQKRESGSHEETSAVAHPKAASSSFAQFSDNRPEALAHKQRQAGINQSQHVKQLKALHERINGGAQLRTAAPPAAQPMMQTTPASKAANKTGLPDDLKAGIENLSGFSMDDVHVHYHSDKPARYQAHAYAEGTDIYLASGQEKHLPHEAWHVVQQKQGRVASQKTAAGNVNLDADLETEAERMGEKSLKAGNEQSGAMEANKPLELGAVANASMQFKLKVGTKDIIDNNESKEALVEYLNDSDAESKGLIIKKIFGGGDAPKKKTWVDDNEDRNYHSWEDVAVMAFFDLVDWNVGLNAVTEKRLTKGNCHAYTMGKGSQDFLEIDTESDAINEQRPGTTIVLCIKNDHVDHSAYLAGEVCFQTLPGGPIFISAISFLKEKYKDHNVKTIKKDGVLVGPPAVAAQTASPE